jgi:hypothetical protein
MGCFTLLFCSGELVICTCMPRLSPGTTQPSDSSCRLTAWALRQGAGTWPQYEFAVNRCMTRKRDSARIRIRPKQHGGLRKCQGRTPLNCQWIYPKAQPTFFDHILLLGRAGTCRLLASCTNVRNAKPNAHGTALDRLTLAEFGQLFQARGASQQGNVTSKTCSM